MEILVFVGNGTKYAVYLDGVKKFTTTLFAKVVHFAEECGVDRIIVKVK